MPLLIFLLCLGIALWVFAILWNVANARGVLTASGEMDFPLDEKPTVSILIPARNEAEILVTSLPRFLQQDYENYEVILADDASTDATPDIAERYQRLFPERLRIVHVDQLPPGWVGKTYALHTAFQQARGEWILATDADIVFHPKALRAGLWLARKHGAGLVSIFAFCECVSFWEKLLLPGFTLMLSTFFPFRKINNPNSSVAIASGGYILMRRRTWESLGGYTSIRSEMIEDLNTARIVKHSGTPILAAVTRDLLSTRMYQDFADIWEGLRKNAFAGNHYSVARLLTGFVLILITNALPLACLLSSVLVVAHRGEGALAAWHLRALLGLSLAQYAMAVALHVPYLRHLRLGAHYALMAPLASIIYGCISLDSMVSTVAGKGVSWKLRHYRKPPSTVTSDE